MIRLSRSATELLRQARQDAGVPEHVKQRLSARVSRSIAFGTVTAITTEVEASLVSGGSVMAPTSTGGLLGRLDAVGTLVGHKTALLAGLFAVGAIATTLYVARTPAPTKPAGTLALPKAPVVSSAEPPISVATTSLPAADAPPEMATLRLTRPPRTTLGFKDELAKLGEARQLLAQGRAKEALAVLRDYERLFPKGELREEASALRIMSRCNLGEPEGARAARLFSVQAKGSPLAVRVSRACKIRDD